MHDDLLDVPRELVPRQPGRRRRLHLGIVASFGIALLEKKNS
jgi:hypothetical protein